MTKIDLFGEYRKVINEFKLNSYLDLINLNTYFLILKNTKTAKPIYCNVSVYCEFFPQYKTCAIALSS